ncbi:putative ribonuclease H-like domain-containing protein [Tanacetum coccineum]
MLKNRSIPVKVGYFLYDRSIYLDMLKLRALFALHIKECDTLHFKETKEDNINNTNNVNAAGTNEVNAVGGKTSIKLPFDLNMPSLEDYSIFDFSRNDEDDVAQADMNNLDITIQVGPIPTTRIHKDNLLDQVIEDLQSATQTRKISKNLEEHGKNPKVYQMDVKSAFLYGKIEEEVYVCQPPGFKDPNFPDRVYKVEKALYGLHQASRALYETLSNIVRQWVFMREIDKIFVHQYGTKGDIVCWSKYMWMISFWFNKKEICFAFEKLFACKISDEFYRRTYIHFGITSEAEEGSTADSDYTEASLDRKSKLKRRTITIDTDEDITLVNVQDDADNEMFDVNVLNGEEVFIVEKNGNVVEEVVDVVQVSTAATAVTITTEEITLAQALEALKTSKPKASEEADCKVLKLNLIKKKDFAGDESRKERKTEAIMLCIED